MSIADRLLAGNKQFTSQEVPALGSHPAQHIAIVTCMDARIDVLASLGLALGDAHILRNAGGRITTDVLRSLALSVHVLGVDTVVVMQHMRCGLENANNAELQAQTEAPIDFLVIDDHVKSLQDDLDMLKSTPYLQAIKTYLGAIYDVDTGRIELIDC
jgi:carbonic anhydrase